MITSSINTMTLSVGILRIPNSNDCEVFFNSVTAWLETAVSVGSERGKGEGCGLSLDDFLDVVFFVSEKFPSDLG